jgi:hypothetical protein
VRDVPFDITFDTAPADNSGKGLLNQSVGSHPGAATVALELVRKGKGFFTAVTGLLACFGERHLAVDAMGDNESMSTAQEGNAEDVVVQALLGPAPRDTLGGTARGEEGIRFRLGHAGVEKGSATAVEDAHDTSRDTLVLQREEPIHRLRGEGGKRGRGGKGGGREPLACDKATRFPPMGEPPGVPVVRPRARRVKSGSSVGDPDAAIVADRHPSFAKGDARLFCMAVLAIKDSCDAN